MFGEKLAIPEFLIFFVTFVVNLSSVANLPAYALMVNRGMRTVISVLSSITA